MSNNTAAVSRNLVSSGRVVVSVHRKCLKAETDRVAEIGIFDNEA